MFKIGIVGCGAMGSKVAEEIKSRFRLKAKVVALFDIDESRSKRLSSAIGKDPLSVGLDELIRSSDLIIEASSVSAVKSLVGKAIDAGKDIMVMSSGGLMNGKAIFDKAAAKRVSIYVPSGALAGLDGVKAAAIGKIASVTLTTTKPPKGLQGAPFIVENRIDLSALKKDTVIFEGAALDAVKAFPANVNVAATLSFASSAPVRIKIIASPGLKRNIHEVEVKGEFGTLTARTENIPLSDNPRTSTLAFLSAVRMLQDILGDAGMRS
ncbi:MAG: aspartate dehydrogenase [Candidatus Omnitrophica bacterium CG1_02_49_10]|nr:MAG: aspartate dehydrogenase [Candidatus Omnitrophica bacterium CG1_02_49_10]